MSTVSSSSALLLVHLRSVALATQAAAVLLAAGGLGMQLPLAMDGLILGALAFMNALAWWYARRGDEPSAWVLTAQLALDIVGLTAFLYFNGGYANPFASLFLLPLAVAATVLPMPHTAGLTALVVAGYSLVMFTYRPLPHYHGSLGDSFDLHLLGMWLSLVVAAVVIAAFVARLAATLRAREAHLAQLREAALRSEQLAALGALAAGTAHELGTPLSTISVIAKELENAIPADAPHGEDVRLLRSQATRCRDILAKLTELSSSGEPFDRTPLTSLIEEVVAPHRDFGVAINVTRPHDGTPEPVGARNPAILYGLGNLVENAVDFAGERVDVAMQWSDDAVEVTISDDGPGFASDILDRIGEPYVTSRRRKANDNDDQPTGLGLGFFIAKTLLERSGAALSFANRSQPQHGAIVKLLWNRADFERLLSFTPT